MNDGMEQRVKTVEEHIGVQDAGMNELSKVMIKQRERMDSLERTVTHYVISRLLALEVKVDELITWQRKTHDNAMKPDNSDNMANIRMDCIERCVSERIDKLEKSIGVLSKNETGKDIPAFGNSSWGEFIKFGPKYNYYLQGEGGISPADCPPGPFIYMHQGEPKFGFKSAYSLREYLDEFGHSFSVDYLDIAYPVKMIEELKNE
jgi:uncharacterized coiled-coil protein SlyX